MRASDRYSNPAVAAILAAVMAFEAAPLPAAAQETAPETPPQSSFEAAHAARLDALFVELQSPELDDWEAVERKIWREWSKSGSAAMDLLLIRGKRAMAAGDLDKAIEHFTALIDHAPDFPEAWNARATAYYLKDQYGPSIEDIRHTLLLEPRHFGALGGLGMILEELGDYENALAAFKAAQAVHPRRDSLIEAVERLEQKARGRSL